MINKKKIKEVLESISNKTQQVNYNLIYDLYTVSKSRCKDKNEFFINILPEITDDFSWDNENVVRKNKNEILTNTKFSDIISYKDFIDKTISLVEQDYRKNLENILKEEFPRNVDVVAIKKDIIDYIYPFFDVVFVVETNEEYALLAIGYGD